MNIALIQINPLIGDFPGNAAKIIAYAEKAARRGCRLAVFPEMALSGQPPRDLLERPDFIAAQAQALNTLVAGLPPEIFVLFGCFELNQGEGKKLFNRAVTVHKGQIVHRADKRFPSSHDLFGEARYFQPGEPSSPLVIDGEYFAITIGQDICIGETLPYGHEPLAELFAKGQKDGSKLTACLNLSALPFARGGEETRRNILAGLARRWRTPFLSCNQVGGQDSLIFAGRSMVLDGQGELGAWAMGFAEDMIVIDSDTGQGERHGPECGTDGEDVLAALTLGLADYVRKCGFKRVALGLSGGIDSALTAAIACRAFGPENVLGLAMPSIYNPEESLTDARLLAKNLGCAFEVIAITPLVEAFQTSLSPFFSGLPEGVAEQNVQARIRGNLLMAFANKFGHLPLTTGNKSEMAVGYCTLYGDMSGGLAVIADCPKGLVYQLSELINRERQIIPRRIIEKAPSAELKPDQRDQDDLPPYPILDAILDRYLEENQSQAEIVAAGFDPAVVADTVRRIHANEYKRQQAPIVLKVTSKARCYPICQNYRG
ncbi:MAG: NAD+ synthase [Desulfobulbaceae bacterium]|jgi:NAD+ synthetase|nr:NAD+ synthase [Desulfobulbaceae bacterium]